MWELGLVVYSLKFEVKVESLCSLWTALVSMQCPDK